MSHPVSRIIDDLDGAQFTGQTRVRDGQTETLAKYVLSVWVKTDDPELAARRLAEKVEETFGPMEGTF